MLKYATEKCKARNSFIGASEVWCCVKQLFSQALFFISGLAALERKLFGYIGKCAKNWEHTLSLSANFSPVSPSSSSLLRWFINNKFITYSNTSECWIYLKSGSRIFSVFAEMEGGNDKWHETQLSLNVRQARRWKIIFSPACRQPKEKAAAAGAHLFRKLNYSCWKKYIFLEAFFFPLSRRNFVAAQKKSPTSHTERSRVLVIFCQCYIANVMRQPFNFLLWTSPLSVDVSFIYFCWEIKQTDAVPFHSDR